MLMNSFFINTLNLSEYLSPEMVLNTGHDQGVDKWALGVLMYEMVTGLFGDIYAHMCILIY